MLMVRSGTFVGDDGTIWEGGEASAAARWQRAGCRTGPNRLARAGKLQWKERRPPPL